MLFIVLVFGVSLQAQTVSAGLSGGWTSLGGVGLALGLDALSALSGGLFLDFEVGPTSTARLAAQFAIAGGVTFSSFETDLVWRFPLGRLVGFAGGGIGLFGIPVDLSPAIHLSLQGTAGLEHNLFRSIVIKATIQAVQVLRLNQGVFPGQPMLRIEVGVGLPFQA